MATSQQRLANLFIEAAFPGETELPKHIETVISHVFVFPTRAYKFYKCDTEFFNTNFHDLSDMSERHAFTARDFKWNNASSPSIYLELIPVRCGEDQIVICESGEEAEELVIAMRRIDTQDLLFERLMQGAISESDSFEIGKHLALSLEGVRKEPTGEHSYFDLFNDRITDSRAWVASVPEIDGIESAKYCDFLDMFRTSHRAYFEDVLSHELAWGGDIHSHNALYTGGAFFLMDTYSPKEAWLLEHWTIPLYRIATDLWALGGKKEYFESCVRGYEEGMGKKIDRTLDPVFILYASVIASAYHYMLVRSDDSKKEAAARFHDFIRMYYASIA